MNTTISTAEARKNFADIVNKVAYGAEPIVLTRRGQKIAALISMRELQLLRRIENLMDIEEAEKALAAAEVWKELGLEKESSATAMMS